MKKNDSNLTLDIVETICYYSSSRKKKPTKLDDIMHIVKTHIIRAPAALARTSGSLSLRSRTKGGTDCTSTALFLPSNGTLKYKIYALIKITYHTGICTSMLQLIPHFFLQRFL